MCRCTAAGCRRLQGERLKKIYGKRTPVVLIVTYGNRAYEDALLELSDILKEQGLSSGSPRSGNITLPIWVGHRRPDEKDKRDVCLCGGGEGETETYSRKHKTSGLSIKGNRPYRLYATLPLKSASHQPVRAAAPASASVRSGNFPDRPEGDRRDGLHHLHALYCGLPGNTQESLAPW